MTTGTKQADQTASHRLASATEPELWPLTYPINPERGVTSITYWHLLTTRGQRRTHRYCIGYKKATVSTSVCTVILLSKVHLQFVIIVSAVNVVGWLVQTCPFKLTSSSSHGKPTTYEHNLKFLSHREYKIKISKWNTVPFESNANVPRLSIYPVDGFSIAIITCTNNVH